MTVKAVESASRNIRRVKGEWDQVREANYPDDESWWEVRTRYAFIDPIIRALGWDTSDPKECYPEYPRPYRGGRADYALFGKVEMPDIGTGYAVPAIIIESKAVGINLDSGLAQLQKYVKAEPSMTEGVAVLTNGGKWRLYRVEGRKALSAERGIEVDIINDNLRQVSQTLNRWLKKTG